MYFYGGGCILCFVQWENVLYTTKKLCRFSGDENMFLIKSTIKNTLAVSLHELRIYPEMFYKIHIFII